MRKNGTSSDRRALASTENNNKASRNRVNNAGLAAHRKNDALGHLHGATFIERVIGFLESYNRTAYGLR